jgi:hypothetical protein
VKLGYIEMGHVDLQGKSHACVRLLRDYTGGALISAAQEARLAARKAGAGAQVYSEDEEEPESSGDDDAGADAAGDGEEEDGEGEGEGEEGENEGGTGTEGDVLTVETSFTRTVLTLLCSAGPKGLMTTELAAKLNMTAKSLVKRIADLVKRYALEVSRTQQEGRDCCACNAYRCSYWNMHGKWVTSMLWLYGPQTGSWVLLFTFWSRFTNR